MDVIVGFCLVVVECGSTFHSVLPFESLGELFQYLIGIVSGVVLRKSDNQFPCLDTFSLSAASFELLPTFPCKARPELGISGIIDGEQVFLSVRAPDIADTSFQIGQLAHLDERMPWHGSSPFFFATAYGSCRCGGSQRPAERR